MLSMRDLSSKLLIYQKAWADVGGTGADVWVEARVDMLAIRLKGDGFMRSFSLPCEQEV